MNIKIKCDCGNDISIPASSRKLVMIRDYLQNKFEIINVKVENNRLKEIEIQCRNCNEWITLNFD
ncbi:MAG: hypothetical protein II988_00020 [Clostridia bacterium]|nr:hypothetical protein [Clostridia bacterium]